MILPLAIMALGALMLLAGLHQAGAFLDRARTDAVRWALHARDLDWIAAKRGLRA